MSKVQISLATVGFASVLGLISGCSGSSHQTVEWYMEHKDERAAKLSWCNNDMARAVQADCLNAAKADESARIGGPSVLDNFEYIPPSQRKTKPSAAAPSASSTSQTKP